VNTIQGKMIAMRLMLHATGKMQMLFHSLFAFIDRYFSTLNRSAPFARTPLAISFCWINSI
jgi:hypothetical protein